MNISVILFDQFESLDVFGPVEVLGKVEEFNIEYYSLEGVTVSNNDNTKIETLSIDTLINCQKTDIILIPGGMGTRREVNNILFLDKIRTAAIQSKYILTVCTGSALLAKTGLLNNKKATSNKRAFDWVQSINTQVNWIQKARWVEDGNIFTSSGISAGIDMTLGFIAHIFGIEKAKQIAFRIEYNWTNDKDLDNFWKQ